MTGKLLVIWFIHKRFLECSPLYSNKLGITKSTVNINANLIIISQFMGYYVHSWLLSIQLHGALWVQQSIYKTMYTFLHNKL